MIEKKLDKYTLGDSPACLYLIDTLNHSNNAVDKNILKQINSFKGLFAQLLSAHDKGHIDTSVVRSFINYKRQDLNIQTEALTQKGYTPLVINLYRNVVIAELKKFQRCADKVQLLEKSATDRAKSLLRNKHLKFNNQTVTLTAYGKAGQEEMQLDVHFNEHGLPYVEVDKSQIKDEITSQTLMDKSIKRLTKQGKIPHKGL